MSEFSTIIRPNMTKPRKKPKKPDAELLAEIRQFIKATRMKPTAFGRAVANDPMLIANVKEGRELRRELRNRVLGFIKVHAPVTVAAAEKPMLGGLFIENARIPWAVRSCSRARPRPSTPPLCPSVGVAYSRHKAAIRSRVGYPAYSKKGGPGRTDASLFICVDWGSPPQPRTRGTGVKHGSAGSTFCAPQVLADLAGDNSELPQVNSFGRFQTSNDGEFLCETKCSVVGTRRFA